MCARWRRTPTCEGLVNDEAAERGPIVFLTVPFRAQAENLNNLREVLQPGADPRGLHRADGGGRGRQGHSHARCLAGLGRPAGAGDGARRRHRHRDPAHGERRRRSATQSAELGEDILVCGDRKADKARVARIIELIPGLRAVNAGALEMARIVEQLTSLLISVNARYKTHAGLRITGLGDGRPLGNSR